MVISVADRKTKTLDKGQLRRLTIAEELVHGPNLVLIDEPITGLDVKDAAVIMTGTLRELVNQERTVICTMHQPSAEAFALFDTLVLLSKGRLIYMGKAEEATAFFINDPKLQFDIKEYANPADFLFDISACLIYNKMVSLFSLSFPLPHPSLPPPPPSTVCRVNILMPLPLRLII
jgi:ABC-type multidrug transport system ATPase subunit